MAANEEVASLGRGKALRKRPVMGVGQIDFPETGSPEAKVWGELQDKLADNLPAQRNWATYGSQAHDFGKRVYAVPEAIDSYAIEFYREMYPGVLEMSQESVRMIGSLLNADDPHGFITTGGTEANLLSVRLARNLGGVDSPEIIIPETRHYSFDLASELFDVKLRLIPVNEDRSLELDAVPDLLNANTVGIVCSTPEMFMGSIDPVEEVARIAAENDLYMHVDAAIGGFMLPFLERLGRDIPAWDFRHPAVMSMTVDPHKLGMCPKPAGGLMLRSRDLLERGIDLDQVAIDTLVASGRPGAATAAVWAMLKHLGADGYTDAVRHQMELVELIAKTVKTIPGMRLLRDPDTNIVCFTTGDDEEMGAISQLLWQRRWAVPLNPLRPSGIQHLRMYVHPLKERASAQAFLADLADAALEVRSGQGSAV